MLLLVNNGYGIVIIGESIMQGYINYTRCVCSKSVSSFISVVFVFASASVYLSITSCLYLYLHTVFLYSNIEKRIVNMGHNTHKRPYTKVKSHRIPPSVLKKMSFLIIFVYNFSDRNSLTINIQWVSLKIKVFILM